jgi:hypothetical protein
MQFQHHPAAPQAGNHNAGGDKGIGIYNDFYIPNFHLICGMQILTVALYRFLVGFSRHLRW